MLIVAAFLRTRGSSRCSLFSFPLKMASSHVHMDVDMAAQAHHQQEATTDRQAPIDRQDNQSSAGDCSNSVDEADIGVLPGEMGELKRVQLANEGMKLLLTSEVKAAEELFRASRFLGPELNAGYSFVQMLQAIMTFDEEAMDFAYKCLEGTEKFCEQHSKKFTLFNSSSSSSNAAMTDKLTEHEKLYRRTIIADCLLFEAILVFLKQGLTSYVKGGYLMRKAWKMYEKIFQDTEKLCTLPSPITKHGLSSPMDKHIGRSLYDKFHEDGNGEVIEDEEESGEAGSVSLDEHGVTDVSDGLAAMHVGLSMLGGGPMKLEFGENGDNEEEDDEGEAECRMLSQTAGNKNGGAPGLLTIGKDDHPLSKGTAKLQVSGVPVKSASAAVLSTNKGQRGMDIQQKSHSQSDLHSKDETDGRSGGHKRGKHYRPQSGYFAPEMPSAEIQSLEHEDSRLRGAVYFGYGLMNIIMSLIPPKLMKLANLFGFHGNRRVGLQALEFASNSQDMKAPLARIGLLWYHTIIRPFFALDGEEEDAGSGEATRLLDDALARYPSSALFLYFRGKVLYLQCQLPEALKVYSDAASLSRDQREVEHIILYEKGWVHFLQLEYGQALPCYVRLKNETRWSACFYAYMAAIITAIQDDLKQSRELFLQTTKLVKRKNNNLEKFCSRRSNQYKKGETPLMALEVRLMAVEVIYLWRALPFCSEAAKSELLGMLSAALPPDAQPVHKAMTAWLKGGVLHSLGRVADAEQSLHDALKYEQSIKYDKHILSFALYELAMIHIGREEYARARMMLNIAKEGYSGYEFEARLNFKVHSAMGLLR